jgi:hypothetical protein
LSQLKLKLQISFFLVGIMIEANTGSVVHLEQGVIDRIVADLTLPEGVVFGLLDSLVDHPQLFL